MISANKFQLSRTIDEDRAALRAPLQSDVAKKQQHVVYADGLRTAGQGQTLRFNLPTDASKFLDTIGSYFSLDFAVKSDSTTLHANTMSVGSLPPAHDDEDAVPDRYLSNGTFQSYISGGDSQAVNCFDLYDLRPMAGYQLQSATTPPLELTRAQALIPVNGIVSCIRTVRIMSRGYVLEEIDNYGLLHTIIKEVTTDNSTLVNQGWMEGVAPHGLWVDSKITKNIGMYTLGGASHNLRRRFAFKLSEVGFFNSPHYIPLEFMPITIEITFHQGIDCIRTSSWTQTKAVAHDNQTATTVCNYPGRQFSIENPEFHAELLEFHPEYTQAVNNKILTDGAVLPIRSWTHTSRFFLGSNDKMIFSNKVKSLLGMIVVPRLHHATQAGGVGMDTFASKWNYQASQVATTGGNVAWGQALLKNNTPGEFAQYRFLIGSNPVTDHPIDCLGGANQFMEMVKLFRGMGKTVNLGEIMGSTNTARFFRNTFKEEYGLICQSFALEKISSDDVFVGQYANTFSDLTLELRTVGPDGEGTCVLGDADKVLLDTYLNFNALLTITPTRVYIES